MNDLLHIVKDDTPQHGHEQQHPRHPQQLRYQPQQQQYEQHYEQQYHDQNNHYGDGYGHDVEEGRGAWDSAGQAAPSISDEMQQFFAKTKEIQMYMSEIRHRQQDLWQMHEQSKTLVRRQEITPHRQRMQVGTSCLVLAGSVC